MSIEIKAKHKRVKRTVLPKVTREQVLAEMPDLAWTRPPHTGPQINSEQAARIADYYYDGQSGG